MHSIKPQYFKKCRIGLKQHLYQKNEVLIMYTFRNNLQYNFYQQICKIVNQSN